MCQPAASARARIYDFRTRGEQPFTALIEAQFAAQPPQKRDPQLPNSGRKVLVFSDGRQKAARLAPALEHSHARDLFRQVAAIAAQKLLEGPKLTGLVWLYPAIVWVCADQRYNQVGCMTDSHNHDNTSDQSFDEVGIPSFDLSCLLGDAACPVVEKPQCAVVAWPTP